MLGYRCNNTVKTLFSKLKDKLDPQQQSNVIYSIPCVVCDSVYVGLTTQRLKSRISNYLADRRKLTQLQTGATSSDSSLVDFDLERMSNKTALIKHCVEHTHEFNYNETKILINEENHDKLKILEMLLNKHRKTVNLRSDVEGLSIVYSGLLNKVKQL